MEIGFTILSLVYGARPPLAFRVVRGSSVDYSADLLSFSVIVYLVVRSNVYKFPVPSLLKIIARDATYYFLIIFSSHVVFVFTLIFGKVRKLPTFFSLLAKASVAYNPTASWPVSATITHLIRPFTGSFSTQ